MKPPRVFVGTDGSINYLSKQGKSLMGVKIKPDGTSSVLAGGISNGIVTLTESSPDGSVKISAGKARGRAVTGSTSNGSGAKPWTIFKP